MTERNALLAIHLGALLFGLSGIFGKLAATTPNMIAGGRAFFAVLALGLAAPLWRSRNAVRPSLRQMTLLALGGLLLGTHWVTFFEAVKVSGVAIATLRLRQLPGLHRTAGGPAVSRAHPPRRVRHGRRGMRGADPGHARVQPEQ